MNHLLTLAILLPAIGSLAVFSRFIGARASGVVCAVAAAPALLLGLFASTMEHDVAWMLLGATFGVDPVSRIFLIFTGALWMACGLYSASTMRSDPRRSAYFFFFLLSMTGNFGLLLARDVGAFYCFFALMTFAAYGLVVHERGAGPRRAGRVYIVMSILGELLLLAGLIFAVAAGAGIDMADFASGVAAAPNQELITALLFFGLGVKAGAIPVHVWLPLAHPVAPTPASAVLSGAMIKAGLFGWIVMLPLGWSPAPAIAPLVVTLGLLGAFGAAIYGALQRDPKTILAYSSVSQMSVMVVAIGAGLMAPDRWPLILGALAIYACSHGFAKGALFLGVAVAKQAAGRDMLRRMTMMGLALAALTIAGAPPLGGAIAKKSLKAAAAGPESPSGDALALLIPLTAIMTTVVLGKFILVMAGAMRTNEGKSAVRLSPWMAAPWLTLTLGAAAAAWLIAPPTEPMTDAPQPTIPSLSAGDALAALWPIALGVLVLAITMRLARSLPKAPAAPAGDLLSLYTLASRATVAAGRRTRLPGPARWKLDFVPLVLDSIEQSRRGETLTNIERAMKTWPVAGAVFVMIVITLAAMIIL
ncbi:MAG: hypothetical protein EA376_02510 [Phycisphaeraceae bacterium]|nr:MAG: hypothetical protein EA376_02510 [Phycisphaeraceae bacterium]